MGEEDRGPDDGSNVDDDDDDDEGVGGCERCAEW